MAVAIGVVVAVVVVLLIGLVLLVMQRAKRRRELQEQYGPEYDRAVEQAGSRSAAERDLAARREQRASLEIVPLSAESRNRYSQSWTQVQGRFVDDPQAAVTDADDLVTAVMRERGYPTEGFDEQARLLSVDHANTLENYRSGHHIAGLARQQQATTEQLRQGMVHYRTLFQELVQEQGPEVGQQLAGAAYGQYDQPGQYQQPGHYQQPGQYAQQPGQYAQPPQYRQPQYGQPPAGGPMEQPTRQMQRPQMQQPHGEPGVQPDASGQPYLGEETNPHGL